MDGALPTPPDADRPRRPLAVAFDVNETLTDLRPVADVFVRLGLGPGSLDWWFAVLLRDGIALAASGGLATFADLTRSALAEVAGASGHDLDEGAGDQVLEAMGRVPLHPDVPPALDRLAGAGVPAYALTNGGAAFAGALLSAGGVVDRLSGILSVEAVGHWKPRPEPYHHAAGVAGVPVDRLALVAVHPWDTHGAAAAGLVTGWVDRGGRPYPAVFTAPTVQAGDLVGVVDRLLDLPEG